MGTAALHVLILADIEGSSGCWSKSAAAALTSAWCKACQDMTADVLAVTTALKSAGVDRITVHDFHRTGYNILPHRLPDGCRLVSGYRAGPVPGLGDPGDATLLMMIGMHAPSGSNGFLAHTLTSRVACLKVNGELLSEAQLFAASLSPFGIRPVFFSGCMVACRQAKARLKDIQIYPIDKSANRNGLNLNAWRKGLADAAVGALTNRDVQPYRLNGPFTVSLRWRDGPLSAARVAHRWNLHCKGDTLHFECNTFTDLYDRLLSICYLTPLLARYRKAALRIYHLWGAIGHLWVRSRYPIHRKQPFDSLHRIDPDGVSRT